MALNTKRINQRREAVKESGGFGEGGEFWTIPEGETKTFLHGQSYPDDDNELTEGYNFIEIVMHYAVGGKRGGQMCLDPIANPIVMHPIVQAFLLERKVPIAISKKTVCPVCQAIRDKEFDDKQAKRQSGKTRWIFGLTPMWFRKSKSDDWAKLKFVPRVLIAGVTIFNKVTGEMVDLDPVDITDPKSAVLLVIERIGTEFDNTEYDLKSDAETIRKPLKLDKGRRQIIEDAVVPAGSCDLFKVASNLIKSPHALKALMAGVEPEDEEPQDEDKEEENDLSCFGIQYEEDDDDCKECEERDACIADYESMASPEEGPGDDDEDDDDDDDDKDEPDNVQAEEDDDDTGEKEEDDDDGKGNDDNTSQEEDPDVSKIAQEADRTARQSRTRTRRGRKVKG